MEGAGRTRSGERCAFLRWRENKGVRKRADDSFFFFSDAIFFLFLGGDLPIL